MCIYIYVNYFNNTKFVSKKYEPRNQNVNWNSLKKTKSWLTEIFVLENINGL